MLQLSSSVIPAERIHGRQAHERAWFRTMAIGRSAAGKAALALWQQAHALCLWLLCVYMAAVEWFILGDWLQHD